MSHARSPGEPTAAWDVARVLLVGSAAALLAAAWFALRPVENPEVQDCGPPLHFIVGNVEDTVVPIGVPEAPENAPQLRTQEPCSQRVVRELERAGLFTVACVGLGVLGAALGLLDDRIQLRRAPPFHELVRERPPDAPGRALDPVVTTVEELADELPPVEPAEVALLAVGGAVGLVGVAALVGVGAVGDALGHLGLGGVAVVAAVAAASRLVAGAGRWSVLDGTSPLAAAAGRDGATSTEAADGDGGSSPGTWVVEAVASGWAARVRPETGVFGVDLHHLLTGGRASRAAAVVRVGAMATAALVVHVVALGVVAVGGVPEVPEPDQRAYLLLLGAVAIGALIGAARVPRVLRAQAVLPSRAAVRHALAPGGRASAIAALVVAVAQVVLEVLALVVVLDALGASMEVRVVALAWLAALTVGAASPFPAGAGLTEAMLALLLWRWGIDGGSAVAAAVVFRLATFWVPALPGLGAARWLRQRAWGRP